MSWRTNCLLWVGFLLGGMARAKAGPIQWSTANGGNGHYYELILPSSPANSYTWNEAYTAASNMVFEGEHGYLATVTSSAENAFLYSTFGSQITPDYALVGGPKGDQVWIGLTDAGHIGNWQWVTGEPFSYSNWAPPEPNFFDIEFYGLYWRRDYGYGPLWSWNNAADAPWDMNLATYGFLVEFSPPFTAAPEPSGLALLSIGTFSLLSYCCRRRRA